MNLFSMNHVAVRMTALIALLLAPIAIRDVAHAAPLATPYVGRMSQTGIDAKREAQIRNQYLPTLADTLTPNSSRLHEWDVTNAIHPFSNSSTSVSINSTVQTSDLTLPTYTTSVPLDSVTLNANGVPALTTPAPTNIDPVWSSDETYIVFASNRTSATNPAPTALYHLYLIETSGYSSTNSSTLVQLTGLTTADDTLSQRYPALLGTSDNTIAYTQSLTATGVQSLVEGTLTVGTSISVTNQVIEAPGLDVQHPTFLGPTIVFAARTGTGQPYHIYELESSGVPEQVTQGPADEENPAASASGSLIAFDSNASGYTYANNNEPNLTSATTIATTRNIWVTGLSGASIIQFTTAGGDNVQPVWTPDQTNTFFNTDASALRHYIFFSSDRDSTQTPLTYGIYYLPAIPGASGGGALEPENSGANSTTEVVKVNVSDPNETYSSMSPAISQLNSYLEVAYVTNRYLINGVNDNPVAGSSSPIAIAPNNYPTSVDTTDTNLNTEIFASRLLDIDPPTLLRYNTASTAIVEVEDPHTPNVDAHLFNAGNNVTVIVRLSDRQSGIGAAYLQIKDPDSATQDQGTTGLEHKVYSRSTGTYVYAESSPFESEVDEATKFDADTGLGFAYAGEYNGDEIALAHTVFTAAANGVSETTTTQANADSTVIAVPNADAFKVGDTVRFAGVTTYICQTVDTANVSTVTVFDPPAANVAAGAIMNVIGHRTFIPQGLEIDCQALDLSSGSPFDATQAANFVTPYYLPSIDDSFILSGFEEPSRPEWLTLSPLATTVSSASALGSTTIVVASACGFTAGDTIQVDTGASQESATVASVSSNSITLTAPLTFSHAVGAAVNEVASSGGGVLYSATWQTPIVPSDYYFDVISYDNAQWPIPYDTGSEYASGVDFSTSNSQNWRIFDNVGGMTTQQFSTSHSILIVNDHDLPQKFFTGRFASNSTAGVSNTPQLLFGSESYITGIDTDFIDANYQSSSTASSQYPPAALADSAVIFNEAAGVSAYATPLYDQTNEDLGYLGNSFAAIMDYNRYAPASISTTTSEAYQNGLGTNSYTEAGLSSGNFGGQVLTGSQGYDIWRVLSRGTIDQNTLNAYTPQPVQQPLDPGVSGSTAQWVLNAGACMIWDSPLTGDQFIEAGTLADPTIQALLTNFQANGGRMFIEGNDIGYDLTSQGSTSTGAAFYANVMDSILLSDTLPREAATFQLNMARGTADYISHDAYLNNTNDSVLTNGDANEVGHLAFSLPTGSDTTGGANYSAPSAQSFATVSNFGSGSWPIITDGSPNADTLSLSIMNAYGAGATAAVPEITGATITEPISATKTLSGSNMLQYTGNPAVNLLPLKNGNIAKDKNGNYEYYLDAVTAVSSFGLDTISQQVELYPVGHREPIIVLNQRTNLLHNLVCTLRTGFISGRVLTTTNGSQPLAGATVTATPNLENANGVTGVSYRATTDSNGDYQIVGVPAGRYTVVAYSEVGITGTYAHTTGNATDVHGGATSTINVSLNQVQPATITVTVLDKATGAAIAGATVTITGVVASGTPPTAQATTNAQGVATFSGVALGTYNASATAPGFAVDSNSTASGLTVAGTTTNLATISLDPVNAGITGTVVNSVTTSPVVGATVVLETTTGAPVDNTVTGAALTTTTDANGAFQLSNTPAPGTYQIVVSDAGYHTQTLSVTTVANTIVALSSPISLVPYQEIVGQVVDGTGVGIADATVTLVSGSTTITETTDTNGNYATSSPTTPGTYTVSASANGYTGGSSVTVTLVSGNTSTAPTITLTIIPTTISGLVSDASSGVALPGATVTVTSTSTSVVHTYVTDANGDYVTADLPPGNYKLTASKANYGTTTPAVSVTLVAGVSQTQNLPLMLEPTEITGIVTDVTTGLPISGASVTVTLPATSSTSAVNIFLTTNSSGVYSTSATTLTPGTYTVTVSATGYVTQTNADVVVVTDEDTSANFALVETHNVYGLVSSAVTSTVALGGITLSLTNTTTHTVLTPVVSSSAISTITVNSAQLNINYEFTNVPSGTYTLNTVPTQSALAQTVTVGGADVDANVSIPSLHTFNPVTTTSGTSVVYDLQMITVPYSFSESGGTLSTNLVGSTGAKLAVWDPTQLLYDVTPQSPADTFHRGVGYWVRLQSTAYVTGIPDPYDATAPFTITLRSGWNMIGNPWPTAGAIAFSTINVVTSAGVVETYAQANNAGLVGSLIYTYSPTASAYVSTDATTNAGVLTPYVGYWIDALEPCSLQVPAP